MTGSHHRRPEADQAIRPIGRYHPDRGGATFERYADGATGTPVDPSGHAWQISHTLLVAGEMRDDAVTVDVVIEGQAQRPSWQGLQREWLLVTSVTRDPGEITVCELRSDGVILDQNTVHPLAVLPASPTSARWWRRRRGFRGTPTGRHFYGRLEP